MNAQAEIDTLRDQYRAISREMQNTPEPSLRRCDELAAKEARIVGRLRDLGADVHEVLTPQA